MLPSRIDIRTRDGCYGVVLDADDLQLQVHWGTIERRQGNESFEHRFIDWVRWKEIKEVVGWDVNASAVTRHSTEPRSRRPARRGTSNGQTPSHASPHTTSVDGAGSGTLDIDLRDGDADGD